MQVRDVDSPFSAKGSIVGLFDALLTLKSQENRQIGKLVDCVEMLARVRTPPHALHACTFVTARQGALPASRLACIHICHHNGQSPQSLEPRIAPTAHAHACCT